MTGETFLGMAQFRGTLALADFDSEGLKNVCDTLEKKGFKRWSKVLNVTDISSVKIVHKYFGRLDIMNNFAGVAQPTQIEKSVPSSRGL